MKKILIITLLAILTVGLFVACNADAVETVTALKYTLTSDNILVDSLGREYKSFVVSKTGETYKLIKILSKNEECLIDSDEKNIIVRTDGGKVTIYAPNAVVEHFGTADSVIVKKVANDSYHCHAKVSKSLSIGAGHVVLNVAVPSVEIKATNDVSVEIVENVKVEQIKIEEPVSLVENHEIKISGIGEAKNIEVNTPVVIDMKAEKVEIRKAVEVEFSDNAKVTNVAVSVEKAEIDALKITVGDDAKIGISFAEEIREDISKHLVDKSGTIKAVHQHSFKTEQKKINDKWYEVTTCTTDDCSYYLEVETSSGPTSFTVNFNTDGGSIITSQTVNEGEKATEPTAKPTKGGYTFDRWYSDEALTNEYDFSTPVTANITLYAKWITYGVKTDQIDLTGKTVLKNQDEFVVAINNLQNTEDLQTLYLGAGTFTLAGLNTTGKNILFFGSGYENTIIDTCQTGGDGNQGTGLTNQGTLAFENVKVTGKKAANYTGFTISNGLSFTNCYFDSGLSNWGNQGEDVSFVNCTFQQEDTDWYNVQELRSESSVSNPITFTFTNCLFESAGGRFINAYKQGGSSAKLIIEVENCKFVGEKEKKSSVNMKTKFSDGCILEVHFKGENVTEGVTVNSSTGSALFMDDGTNGTVYVNDILVWQNGKKVQN